MKYPFDEGVEWLQDLRRRMLETLLGAVVILGGVGIVFSIYRVLMGDTARNLPYYLGAYFFALLLFFAPRLPIFRELPPVWRAYSFLVGLYVFGVLALLSGWLAGGGRVFLVALIVAAAVLVDTRAGFAAAILDLVTFSAFGLAYSRGWLHLRVLPDPTTPGPIITEGVGFAIAIGITVLGLWLIRSALTTAIQATQESLHARELLLERAQQLDEANQLLSVRTQRLEQINATLQERAWVTTAHGKLDEVLRGDQSAATLANRVVGSLCRILEAQVGAFYVLDNPSAKDGPGLSLLGKYAFAAAKANEEINPITHFRLGEGLVGQVAKDGKMLQVTGLALDQAVRESLLMVQSGLGETLPASFLFAPVLASGQVNGVIELATLEGFNPLQLNFIKDSCEKIGAALASAQARERIEALLAERK